MIYRKNYTEIPGWLNRHTTPMPDKKCVISIITLDVSGEHEDICERKPFVKEEYSNENMPAEGYLGTATIIAGKYVGIGFHAWEQNNSEFVYYQILKNNYN